MTLQVHSDTTALGWNGRCLISYSSCQSLSLAENKFLTYQRLSLWIIRVLFNTCGLSPGLSPLRDGHATS